MFRTHLVASTFFLLGTGSLAAQYFSAERTVPRRLTRVAWTGQSGVQRIAIEYGQPEWAAEYDSFMRSKSPRMVPLGSDALTTLETDVDLVFGDTKVRRGRWYLGLRRDEQQKWSLTLVATDKPGATAFPPKPDLEIAMQVEHDAEPVKLLDIQLAVPDRRKPMLEFKIAWGAYRVHFPVTPAFDQRVAKGTPEFAPKANEPVVTTGSGLRYQQLQAGSGALVAPTDTVRIHYTCWLSDGTLFDTTHLSGEPVTLPLEYLLKGFAEGVQRMKPGETCRLTIPPELAYGARGAGEVVPPNATLVFVVTLLGIEK